MGAAVGTIMATIMKAHIANVRPNSVTVQGFTPVIPSAIESPFMPPEAVIMRCAVTTT
jgi:hypothetical protein